MNYFNNYCWNTSLPLFKLEGQGCKNFLNSQTTFDVLGIKEGNLFRTCWLSPIGRFKALLEAKVVGQYIYFVVLIGDSKELIDGLNKVIFPLDRVEIYPCDQIIRLQIISMHESWKESETQWLPKESKMPEKFVGLKTADQKFIQQWKTKQGFPDDVNKTLIKFNPFEIGFSDFVNLEKGCYLGQESLSKLKNIGRLKYHLRFFESDKKLNPGDKINLPDTYISDNLNKNVGVIYSSIPSEKGNTAGLAFIRSRFSSTENLTLDEDGGKLNLKIPIGFKEF